MRQHFARILLATVAFGALSAPVVVEAQSVIVLGLRSAEGDDEFANNLSGALRNAASRVNGWELNTREVSLAQMALAHGCDASDIGCIQQIGDTLGVRQVIYGTVRRSSTRSDYDYVLSLFMFDTEAGSISAQLTDTIPKVQSDIDDLRGKADDYITRFSGAERTGTIRIQVNLAAAEVIVDGESLGMTTGGAFETTVAVGPHQIEVRAEGHSTFRGSVSVVADDVAEVEVELVEGDESEIIVGPEDGTTGPSASSGGGLNWPAIISFAFAGVGAALTITSWIVLDGISGNQEFQDDRAQVGQLIAASMPGASKEEIEAIDACQYMRDNNSGGEWTTSIGKCDDGDLWTALQYVFIGVTGVALAAGIVFLVIGGDDEEAPSSTVSILPSIGPGRGSVTARVTF
jgi:hypothetical protein